MDLSVIPYREYVYSECVRQWHEIQEVDGLGPWESQSEEEQHEYFEDMYEHLWDDRFELDYVTIPRRKEKNAWKRLRREEGTK